MPLLAYVGLRGGGERDVAADEEPSGGRVYAVRIGR